jgi:hypothetical protein
VCKFYLIKISAYLKLVNFPPRMLVLLAKGSRRVLLFMTAPFSRTNAHSPPGQHGSFLTCGKIKNG